MFYLLVFQSEAERSKFDYLYQQYKNLMLHKAYGILKDYSLAEDAVSEAYLRVFKNLHKIDDVTSNRCISFLVTIVKNTALTMLKQQSKYAPDELTEDRQDDFVLDDHVLAAVTAEEIYRVVNTLQEDLRQVFLLRYAHDYSNKEIARMMDISQNHVGVLLFRAKGKLLHQLKQEGYMHEKSRG